MTAVIDWLLATFARPWLLPLAPLAGGLVLGALLRLRARRRARLARLGDLPVLERLLPAARDEGDDRRRALLLGTAATCIAIALAGPRWGERPDVRRVSGVELALVLDVSASMLAEDDAPSRLERMRRDVRDLLAALPGSRAALVVVAGKGYVLTPLTADHDALALFLDELSPAMVSQGGTALGDGIRRGLQVLGDGGARGDRALVVFSDGESWDDDGALQAATAAKEAGVVAVVVGYGRPDGATIPLRDARGTQAKRDGEGRVVITRGDPERLAAIARAAEGTFVPATIANHVPAIRGALQSLRRSERVRRAAATPIQRFAWFLWPAFGCLLLDALLPFAARQRGGARRGPVPVASGAAAALLLVVLARGGEAQGAATRPAPPARRDTAPGADERDANALYRARRLPEAVRAYRQVITGGDRSPRAWYNLGTALVAADSFAGAGEALERALQGTTDAELRYRALYNLGLAQLRRGTVARGGDGEAQLDAAIATYKRVLRLRSGDRDAAFNLELALRERTGDGGGGGGGGGGGAGSPRPAPQAPPSPRDEELEKRRAEAVLDNAARDERDVLGRRQRQRGRAEATGERDW